MKEKDKKIEICDECDIPYFEHSSKMARLCPHCAHILYGYPDCEHIFENGKCIKCLFQQNEQEYKNS